MKTVYLIDLDETLFDKNTWNFKLGAKEVVDRICDASSDNHVVFFSCRYPSYENLKKLRELFPKMQGFLHKPHAEKYIIIDDLLDLEKSKNHLKDYR